MKVANKENVDGSSHKHIHYSRVICILTDRIFLFTTRKKQFVTKYKFYTMIVHVMNFFMRALQCNMSFFCVKIFSNSKLKDSPEPVGECVSKIV